MEEQMLLINAKIYDEDFILRPYDVRVKDGKFSEIAIRGTLTTEPDETVLDLTGKILAPGLIDQHTHGALSRDTMDADAESIEIISRHLAAHGITSFLPTTMTMGNEHINAVFDNQPETTSGAEVLGYHMEGPFINVEKKGAQNPEYVRGGTMEEMNEFLSKANVLLIDIAPEVNNNQDFIKELSDKVICQVGHCLATYEDTLEAMKNGARGLCHGFNAMPGIHHRNPGPLMASLELGNYTEIIADGLHINPAVVYAAYKMFGPERMILISDALKTTGNPDGEYMFGGQPIVVTDGVARVKATGDIAGGSSNVWQEVRNCVSWGIPQADALRMGSLTPATYLGVADRKGSISVGKDADFVITNSELEIHDVYLKGRIFE